MDGKQWTILCLILLPVFIEAWSSRSSREDKREPRDLPDKRDLRRHYHSKRHMQIENEPKMKRITTQKPSRDLRKKPSGHLAPLEEDDMDNDEVISVAIGPPPIRPKYDKVHWKHPPKPTTTPNVTNATATNLIKDILTELGRELISRHVSEDFIFGQYIGNSMKNLTAEIKLKLQHEVLDLIVKYQKISNGEAAKHPEEKPTSSSPLAAINHINSIKDLKTEKKFTAANETEDTWPDFSNLKL
ncbi:unnamed protein product [Arctia plantaginis]|uniref:Uncharacterized protein n=1 Tax=Arctia plantaginis TaxID=874455 RepID=A0A8S1AYK5_ARCPL|nr:unnamed protein product [Arctia plantaginis]